MSLKKDLFVLILKLQSRKQTATNSHKTTKLHFPRHQLLKQKTGLEKFGATLYLLCHGCNANLFKEEMIVTTIYRISLLTPHGKIRFNYFELLLIC